MEQNEAKFVYLNARSVKSVSNQCHKPAQLQALLELEQPDIITITETWLTSYVKDTELFPSNFTVHRKDREASVPGKAGGGALIAVRDCFASARRSDLEPNDEIMVCDVKASNAKKLAVIAIYRPPDGIAEDFRVNLETTMLRVSHEYDDVCLLGDFNFPSARWSNGEFDINSVSHLCNVICQHSLSQLNKVPSNKHKNLLDLVFVNDPDLYSEVVELPAEFNTDHIVLTFSRNLSKVKKPKFSRSVFNFKNADFEQLRSHLNVLPLCEVVSNSTDVDNALSNWADLVNGAVNQVVPKVTIKNSNSPPWVDSEVRHLNNKKKTAWRKAKHSDLPNDWAKFRRLRNEVQSCMSHKYNSYLDSLSEGLDTNSKRLWSFIRSKTKTRTVPGLTHDDKVVSDPGEKARAFNQYFHSVFLDDETTVLPDIDIIENHQLSNMSFSTEDVAAVLVGLDTTKACGPDQLSPHVLKHCAYQLAPSLALLFNLSMSASVLPSNWKLAHVAPIHKKGPRDDVENYRPVSLLSILSKVMERCVFNHIYEHVSPLITPLQHGFVKGKSCQSQLLDVYHQIGSTLDQSGQTDIIFLDFSKAFDSVSHVLLIHKLQSFGFSGILLKWLKSYLSNRQQRVVIEGSSSPWLPVKSGVPQGSILGPLLFLLYINDMPQSVLSSSIALFADDVKCFHSVNSIGDCLELQRDLDLLSEWSTKWKLNFNVKKCMVLSVTRRWNKVNFSYLLNGTILQTVDSFKDLGVTISHDLSWSSQVSSLVSKCNQTMGMVKRAIGFKTSPSLSCKLYQSLVRSKLEYASCVWSPYHHKDIKLIESIQRSATRYILHYPDNMSYNQRCSALNLLPLSFRREIADAVYLFKYIHEPRNYAISRNFVSFVPSNTRLRSASHGRLLKQPFSRTVTFENSYFNRVVHIWNSLPRHIRDCSDLNVFKHAVNQFYWSKLMSYDADIPSSWTLSSRLYSGAI